MFDLIGMALAECIADEASAAARPVVIDLDEYGIGTQLLYLFNQGGGIATLDDNEDVRKFWNDVSTNRDILLKLVNGSGLFLVGGCSRFILEDACTFVGFSFLLQNDIDLVLSVSASIGHVVVNSVPATSLCVKLT